MMTKHIIVTLIGSVLAFMAGMVTVGSWHKATGPAIAVQPAKADVTQQPSASSPPASAITPEPTESEVVFAKGRLRIVSEEEHLASDRLQYKINVRYPQIAGSNAPYITKLNRLIKQFVVDHYRWALNPSKAELRRFKTAPEPYNLVGINYDIALANDSILSIFFFIEDYYIGAAHSAIRSHVINYDLRSHRELKLADLFKPRSKYLEFIARYCTDELKLLEPIAPKAATFASWNLTDTGIRFNFDPCDITGCSDGPHEVDIPFSALRPFLKPGQVV